MALQTNEEKCFSIEWKIENISFRPEKVGEFMRSPTFVVDSIGKAEWQLHLFPSGEKHSEDYINIYLWRKTDANAVGTSEVKFQFSFRGEDGSVLYESRLVEYSFTRIEGCGLKQLITQEDVFYERKSMFIPGDTLTVLCKMWKKYEPMLLNVRCFARTRIAFKQASFLWNIENFSNLQLDKRCSFVFKSPTNEQPLMSVDLYVTPGINSEEIIRLELTVHDKSIKHSDLLLSLVDASGFRAVREAYEFWFDGEHEPTQFTFHLTRAMLLADKNVYLPNDVLSLRWEWTNSKGVISSEIEKIENWCTPSEENGPPPNSLMDNVKSFYDEKFLCDVKLKTSTSIFPAHKVILSASSSIFKTLISNMQEGSDYLDIEDLGDDAVSNMLFYIYTSSVKNLTLQSATELYAAANKFAIPALKNICSCYLKDILSISNALEMLLLTDNYAADDDLKGFVMNYIGKHGKEIQNSEWKLLINSNANVAAEALYRLFNVV